MRMLLEIFRKKNKRADVSCFLAMLHWRYFMTQRYLLQVPKCENGIDRAESSYHAFLYVTS